MFYVKRKRSYFDRFRKKISIRERDVLDVLYNPNLTFAGTNKGEKLIMANTSNRVAFSKAIPPREQHDFIKAEEVEELGAFDIIGARRFNVDNKNQILFDIEFERVIGKGKTAKSKLEKCALTLNYNEEREDVMNAVREHHRIGPVKLERVDIKGGKTYLQFVESKDVPF